MVYHGSDVAQPIFMVLITWAKITICGSMLIMNMQIVQYHSQSKKNSNYGIEFQFLHLIKFFSFNFSLRVRQTI